MNQRALRRLAILGVLLVIVNLLLWTGGAWVPSRIYFSGLLLISAWPLIHLVADPSADLPGFSVILMIYGGYYGLMGLIPFDPYKDLALVPEPSMQKAGLLGFLGILALQLGYHLSTRRKALQLPVSHPGPSFSLPRIALLGVLGVLGWIGAYAGSVPVVIRSLATLASELLTLAFIVLLEAQIRGKLARKWKVLNWGLFAPTILLTALGASKLFPLVRLALIIFIVYFFVRRQVPWKALLVGTLLLFPIFLLKVGIRQFDAATNKLQNQTLASTKDRLALYGAVLGQLKQGASGDLLQLGIQATANRFDLTHTFGYVIANTPAPVPYLEGETYKSLIWKLIPRAIYPQKSIENWGNEFGHRYGWLAPDDDDTTVNLPQMVEWYVNFGPWGVPIGMLLIGLIYGGLKSLLYRDGTISQGLFCVFVFSQFFNIESNFSLVFGSLPYAIPLYVLFGRWALNSKRLKALDENHGGPDLASTDLAEPIQQ